MVLLFGLSELDAVGSVEVAVGVGCATTRVGGGAA